MFQPPKVAAFLGISAPITLKMYTLRDLTWKSTLEGEMYFDHIVCIHARHSMGHSCIFYIPLDFKYCQLRVSGIYIISCHHCSERSTLLFIILTVPSKSYWFMLIQLYSNYICSAGFASEAHIVSTTEL